MLMASLSPSPPPTSLSALSLKSHPSLRFQSILFPRKLPSLLLSRSADNGAGVVSSAPTVVQEEEKEKKNEEETPSPAVAEVPKAEDEQKSNLAANGAAVKAEAAAVPKFKDTRWVGGTWDLKQFKKNGETDWDAVVDAEVRRRKWLQDNPEASSDDEPVLFDTSIIPWWTWVKRFHLPEAEILNGRAAMVGFFMAYFVDSLTGVGLVDQTGNFFCKTLLFIAVAGVLLIRKNEDIDNLKKILEETTFYDKQWQATWQEDQTSSASKEK
ncbi:hypothetical protein Cni_G15886 [Canna indica]|uniref:Lil3 protein n=1 Tax=Canna indica TaxID=4628 RepID=A0AAQ3KE82_9LILI|nr:hypothetical protein Cni_G15886 [Canna indica]